MPEKPGKNHLPGTISGVFGIRAKDLARTSNLQAEAGLHLPAPAVGTKTLSAKNGAFLTWRNALQQELKAERWT
jgi:hypothetical protein